MIRESELDEIPWMTCLSQCEMPGQGLDPGSVDRLFDTFYTIDLDGMGMGLAICRLSTLTRATVG